MHTFFTRYILSRTFFEHIISCTLLIGGVIIFADFLVFFLTTFLCATLFHAAAQWLYIHLKQHKYARYSWLQKIAHPKILITLLYCMFVVFCVTTFRDIGPALVRDVVTFVGVLSEKFGMQFGLSGLENTLTQWQTLSDQVTQFLGVISPNTDVTEIISQLYHIGSILLQIILGIVVSYIWLIEYDTVRGYFGQLRTGPFAFLYNDLQAIFTRITRSFGLVFHAQTKIALMNTLLTVIGLLVIGVIFGQIHQISWAFPYILALTCITFLTSFVPILGVFIGGVPILLAGAIAYPGWSSIIVIIGMLLVIHAIEGYFLNPKIVGQSLNVPTPIIFIILIITEHFMGVAGFFLGVPLYLLSLEACATLGAWYTRIQTDKEKI